jgi:tetratricopeptide (TPR) repeat protein
MNLDPVGWNLPFNRIVGVLGNPDFASALLGLSAIIFAYFAAIQNSFNSKFWLPVGLSLFSVFLAFATNARQGVGIVLLAFLFASSVLGFKKNFKIGMLIMLFSVGVTIFSLFGMLRIGPFASILYKDSIMYRGDYWRAAFSMFDSNPIFGVGFGRYGDFFREYRDLDQVSRRGSGLISDQAHSIPLDFLASGGLLVFVIYLVFVLLISRLAVISCLRAKSHDEIILAIVLSCLWFGYFAQALISIDQIGLAIWGWVFAALVVTNSQKHKSIPVLKKQLKSKNENKLHFTGLLVALIIIVSGIVGLTPIWKSDVAMRIANALATSGSNNPGNQQEIIAYANQIVAQNSIDSYYFRQSGVLLASNGQVDSSIQALRRSIELNNREAVSYAVLGSILRQTGKPEESLPVLEKAIQLDPLNQMNYYEKLQSYLATNNLVKAEESLLQMREISKKSKLYLEAENLINNAN